jgi:lycopene beta-cyclase
MPPDFEHAILGGGAAGISLALALTRSPLAPRSILIVDKEQQLPPERTWCYWTDAPDPLDAIRRHAWSCLSFLDESFTRTWDLAPFRYQMVRSVDFYEHARAVLKRHNVTFVGGEGALTDGQTHASLMVALPAGGSVAYTARYAYDSRIQAQDLLPRGRSNALMQHFLGWEVETSRAVFDPLAVTLFDLRTPQRGGITFFYILPFSPNHAQVEYTLFSPARLPEEAYASALQGYLERLGAGTYRLLRSEAGVIPMTDLPFPRRLGRHILSIGTRGGRVKPSTGYAFARIQRDSTRIVHSLIRHDHPFAIPPDPLRFRLHDSVLLELLVREPELGRPVFSAIFAKNPIQRVLKFLDNRSTPLEDLSIMGAHAPAPFLRAIGRRFLWRKHA